MRHLFQPYTRGGQAQSELVWVSVSIFPQKIAGAHSGTLDAVSTPNETDFHVQDAVVLVVERNVGLMSLSRHRAAKGRVCLTSKADLGPVHVSALRQIVNASFSSSKTTLRDLRQWLVW